MKMGTQIKKAKVIMLTFSLSLFTISQTEILSKKDFRENVIFYNENSNFLLNSKVVKIVART